MISKEMIEKLGYKVEGPHSTNGSCIYCVISCNNIPDTYCDGCNSVMGKGGYIDDPKN